MPTIHISQDLMDQIKENRASENEPPTATLERLISQKNDDIENKIEEKIYEMVREEALI